MFAPEVLDPAVDCLASLAGGGRVLEFAIGSGRVALPLARRGLDVTGIELSADMLAEFQLAFVVARSADVTTSPDAAWRWVEEGWRLFPEARADRVTWSYAPMEPWHLAYTPGVRALDVDIDGEPAMRGGVPTRVDAAEIRARAAEQAVRLHARL